jgi:hypothetical protein
MAARSEHCASPCAAGRNAQVKLVFLSDDSSIISYREIRIMRHNFICFLLETNEKSYVIFLAVVRFIYVSTDIDLGVVLKFL